MRRKLTISIVTPCYNMAEFVEDTLQSVTIRKSDADEYIFVDGGSSDKTLEIAKKYADKIDILISEPDDGQYHAISKGFEKSSGDIMGWINADDTLMPWTMSVVREIFDKFPEVDWITGSPSYMNAQGQMTRIQAKLPAYPRRFIANGWYQKKLGAYLQQESMFWRRSLWDRVGGLNTNLSLTADFDLWVKFSGHADLIPVDIPLAAFRERPGAQLSDDGTGRYDKEIARICAGKPKPPVWWRWISGKGLVARCFARLLIYGKGKSIAYDRKAMQWVIFSRRRSISRVSLSSFKDEWLMQKSVESK